MGKLGVAASPPNQGPSEGIGRRRFAKFLAYAGAIAGAFLVGNLSSSKGDTVTAAGSTTRATNTYSETAGPIMTYPYMNIPSEVVGGTYWKWGEWIDIIPAGTIKSDFLVVGIHMHSNDIEGAIELGSGGKGSEVVLAHLPSSASASAAGITLTMFLPSPIRLKAGSGVAMRYTVGIETPRYIRVKILYQETRPS